MKQSKKCPSLNIKDPLDVLRKCIISFGKTCLDVHPFAARAVELARSRSWDTLYKETALVPNDPYGDATKQYVVGQLRAFVLAYPYPTGVIRDVDPEAAALQKFEAAEHRCKWVNRKFRALKKHGRWLSDWRLRALERARQMVHHLLGETPNYAAVADQCDFTSGAAIGVHGNATNIARKLRANWSVSPLALPYAIPFLWRNDHFRNVLLPGDIKCYDRDVFEQALLDRIELVPYNKIGFVPKKVNIHRVMATESALNNYCQNGVDKEMRLHLKRRWGVDLSDQDRNARLARDGSENWDSLDPFVTLDLSSASDLISIEVVRYLLPPEWFELLDALRSHSYQLNGETRVYEKFCSMGNGFCFPLESMIFAAMAKVCGEIAGDGKFSVYGDDIIVRKSCALILKELLGFVGFRVNEEKSYINSPFRESCGSDWVEGRNVRPVNFDKPLEDLRQVFAVHNTFLRHELSEQLSEPLRCELRSYAPKWLRPGREPGDTAFSVPLDVAVRSPHVRWSKQRQRWVWKEILSLPVLDEECLKDLSWIARRDVNTYALLRGATPCNMQGRASLTPPQFTLRYRSRPKVKTVSRWWSDDYPTGNPLGNIGSDPFLAFSVPERREYRESASPSKLHWVIWNTNMA